MQDGINAWFQRALPKVRDAYYAHPKYRTREGNDEPRGGSALRVVDAVIHYRSVKKRRFTNAFYGEMVRALRDRHARYIASSLASGVPRNSLVRLRVTIHGDQDPAKSSLLTKFANYTGGAGDVDVVVRSAAAGKLSFNDTLAAFHELVEADVLLPSHSSFSISAALLGNMTVLFPSCDRRYPLPHWRPVPCFGAIDLSGIPWPPPPNPARVHKT